MRRQDVESWAMGRGFVLNGDVLTIDYLEGRIDISFGARTAKAVAVSDGKEQVLGRGYLQNLFVNEHEVLEGLGLSASMIVMSERLGVSPPWFTHAYCEALGLPAPYRKTEAPAP